MVPPMIGKMADISELNNMIDRKHGGATRYSTAHVIAHMIK